MFAARLLLLYFNFCFCFHLSMYQFSHLTLLSDIVQKNHSHAPENIWQKKTHSLTYTHTHIIYRISSSSCFLGKFVKLSFYHSIECDVFSNRTFKTCIDTIHTYDHFYYCSSILSVFSLNFWEQSTQYHIHTHVDDQYW